MNILDTIVEHKRVEVLVRKQKRTLSSLNTYAYYRRKTNIIDHIQLADGHGIIAEFKRKSPSKGPINMTADPVTVAAEYREAGAVAMSILTDRDFFGGSLKDLQQVREAFPDLVLLRKDFIIDPYQLHEASAYGADMVLLIAAILDQHEVTDLALEAQALGLQVLFEVHCEDELQKYHPSIGFVGVNNRDLKTFQVDTGMSLNLIGEMPEGVIAVSESGISKASEIEKLSQAGYQLFLIGETFMKENEPGEACRQFIEQL